MRETGMLLLFLILLFSYSGKTVLRTKAPEKNIKKNELKVSKTNAVQTNRFFQLKPRIFPITLHGRTPQEEKSSLKKTNTLVKTTGNTEELDFVFTAPVPWYQYYYFPGEEGDYSAAS
ncbi:MAG: hypothetical protein JNL60_01175 [Bacteroidia bacterium]|nr:hypothetical protein [Bacteroidia bacterium]